MVSSKAQGAAAVRTPKAGMKKPFDLEEISIAGLRQGMERGHFTSESVVRSYWRRIEEIDERGPHLRSVLEKNPDAIAIAKERDRERKQGRIRGPLHGIPILVKDNIDTADRMTTTAGSLALQGSTPSVDAFLVQRLRLAGAVILGKTNLSEWANFRGRDSISGWSARGGLCRNPYYTDRSAAGSSTGSAVAVSANLCAAAIGTETDGSIVSPASYCGVVGLKPTVGLISRSGVIPISSSQDTAGPMGRSVADVAALLGALTGVDDRDSATLLSRGHALADYTPFLNANALSKARVGFVPSEFHHRKRVEDVFQNALEIVRDSGATLLELPKPPNLDRIQEAEFEIMLFEFKAGLNAYFKSLGPTARVQSMEDLIAFNQQHPKEELSLFGQEHLIQAQEKGELTEAAYLEAKARCAKWSAELEDWMRLHSLDVWVLPTTGPAHVLDQVNGDHWSGGSSTYAAVSGLPSITQPCGNVSGLPVGLSWVAPRWQEGALLSIAYSFEQRARARFVPQFLPTLDL